MGLILECSSHSKCLKNAKNANMRVYYFRNLTKTESQFQILCLDFFDFSLQCNIELYVVVLGRTKNQIIIFNFFEKINVEFSWFLILIFEVCHHHHCICANTHNHTTQIHKYRNKMTKYNNYCQTFVIL